VWEPSYQGASSPQIRAEHSTEAFARRHFGVVKLNRWARYSQRISTFSGPLSNTWGENPNIKRDAYFFPQALELGLLKTITILWCHKRGKQCR
jgi:hypothetical protein